MRRPAWVLLLPVALAAATGCAGKKPTSEVVEPAAQPVTVEVRNSFALPVELFAEGGGASFRLGVVHPGMEGRFTVPLNITQGGSTEFTVTANAKSMSPWKSGPMLIASGSIVDINVAQRLFATTAAIRP